VSLEKGTAALTTTENVKSNLTALSDVLQFVEDFMLAQKAFDSMAFSGTDCYSAPRFDPETGEETGEYVEECEETEPEDEDIEVNLDEVAQDIVDELNKRVFVDSQIEEETGTSVTYLLSPAVFCAEDEEEGGAPDKKPADDISDPLAPEAEECLDEEECGEDSEDCAEFLDKVPVRLKFTSPAEGEIEVDILVGAEKAHVFRLEFYKDILAIEIDWAEAKAAIEVITKAFEAEDEDTILPDVLEGVVRLELKRDAAGKFTLSLVVKEALKEELTVDGETYLIEVGPGSISATADKDSQTITFSADLGKVVMSFPYQLLVDASYEEDEEGGESAPLMPDDKADSTGEPESEAPKVSGTVTVQLSGYSFTASAQAKSESFDLTNVGLGAETSFVKVNGDTIFSLDLNPADGRTFDLNVALDGDDNVTWTMSPKFDLSLLWNLAKVADDMKDVPESMLSETWRFLVDGGTAQKILFGESDDGRLLKMLEGKLTISSTAAPAETVVVDAGMCLFGEEDEGEAPQTPDGPNLPADDPSPDEDGHELLSSFQVGTCE